MLMTRNRLLGVVAVVLACSLPLMLCAQDTQPAAGRAAPAASPEKARKEMQSGNYKDAYEAFSPLALDTAADPKKVGEYMTSAVQCLHALNRSDEVDAFREKVIALHAANWRLLWAAAQTYNTDQHNGYIVAGKYYRGYHRGGGKWVGSYERDRIRALQLMEQASAKTAGEEAKAEVGKFYFDLAAMLLGNRGYNEAWRLQYLTDLTTLPDYDEGNYYGGDRGAPVNEDGTPVYHKLPKTWKDSASDGERWRWCLMQAAEWDATQAMTAKFVFAQFLQNQFGVATMAEYGWFFGRGSEADDDTKKNESGTYAVHTLGEDETIAKLATGIKRFKLPDEFNYVKIFREIADAKKSRAEDSLTELAREFENRRQYPVAADTWKRNIQEFGAGKDKWKDKELDQIEGNWGLFEPLLTQPAGQGATVDFRFRNGKKVNFEAYEIDTKKLLDDVKEYLKSAPKQLDWWKVDIANLGYRLVEENQKQYMEDKPSAQWSLDLTPRPNHWDKRVTVATPLQKAGAYLLVAKMEGGNVSRIVVWIADTVIVKKPLDKKAYYFVADAVTGQPVAKANLEFFGYKQEWVQGTNSSRVDTKDFAEFTDPEGQCMPDPSRQEQNYSWVVIATTPQGRLAYLGFTSVWYGNYYDQEYNQSKVFVITDRPVYRPEQPIKFKFWVNQAKYDQDGKSPYAGEQFTVWVKDPKGEKVFEKVMKADEYGGFDGELKLDKEATLGQYSIYLPSDQEMSPPPAPAPRPRGRGVTPAPAPAPAPAAPAKAFVHNRANGGGSFRLEEYKKPEFEVTVEAPKEPVMLGDKIEAKIQAKYYFGAPVTEGKVKYKVMRTGYSATWYPVRFWDWCFGPGYWWFASDYPWYPGWREWGCARPIPWWWTWYRPTPPEVVAEAEAPLGKDGTVTVQIDTAVAKAIHGDTDHKYEITAEVTDQSRRTIVGTGSVIAARKPFKVYAWVDRGHYRAGDVVLASFFAQTPDHKPVKGKGELRLLKITYKAEDAGKDVKPVETEVGKWNLDTNEEGRAQQQIKAAEGGQYRLSYKVTDDKQHAIEGGYLFLVVGEGFDGAEFRFNDIELTADKAEYQPDDKVGLLVNTNRKDSTVLLFIRPANGIYLAPKVLHLKGKSVTEQIEVIKKDMPNFFVEALTVSGGKVYTEMKELVVPPEKRVLNVDVKPIATSAPAAKPPLAVSRPSNDAKDEPARYKPGEKAKFLVKLTDPTGEPYSGSTVVSIYDKSVEYISGGSNVPEIKEFFWKWRRHHNMSTEHSLAKGGGNTIKSKEIGMAFLGVFGASVPEELEGLSLSGGANHGMDQAGFGGGGGRGGRGDRQGEGMRMERAAAMPMAAAAPGGGADMLMDQQQAKGMNAGEARLRDAAKREDGAPEQGPAPALATVRTNFADTALWIGALQTNVRGEAEVELTMPENLTTWKARVWAMGMGSKVGEGAAEVVTTKNLIIRLQAPRFFVQKDEVVLSANVHNYLKTKKSVKVVLEVDEKGGAFVSPMTAEGGIIKTQRVAAQFRASKLPGFELPAVSIDIDAGGEKRVDWRIRVDQPGEAVIRMKALTDEESDATEMKFPVFIHGMIKTESFSGVIRPDKDTASVTVKVPAERKPELSRLEIRYSPTLAGAMVDALPYMLEYPYGCTEQTLNRFLPAVITQKVLIRMGLDLKDIKGKITNLNAQEIGADANRAKDWSYRGGYMSRGTARVVSPVFDEAEMTTIVKSGVEKLGNMQLSDGGWGWFSGWGEHSWPHTTAVVVHGLQIARANDVAAIVPGVIERGVKWLGSYQADQLRKLRLPKDAPEFKLHADDLDAFVFMVLVDEKLDSADVTAMKDFLYRDRNELAVYSKAMFGLALHKLKDDEKRDMLRKNVEQYLAQDDENQTAWLNLPAGNMWWCWHGSEMEAHAYYLKLLCAVEPKSEVASRLVKYLNNNRKHATYWNSTRDTSVVIEAFADYLKASGEDAPDMTVEISIDGKAVKEVKIDKTNLFSFDNKLVLEGEKVTAGEHKIELRRKGKGPVYFNAYLTNFTLEDPITKAGLEIKVNRKYYKLVEVDKKIKAEGTRGQAVDQKVLKYDRQELKDLAAVKSGDLVEIEMEIDSKNDYEYIVFEDMKAAGFEPVDLRSGYNANDLGAYMELRDERVTFFVRQLMRGKHSVSYRMRAEIPGKFSALPTKASAMYAPELKANSDEIKLLVTD
jgi:uncharacterized protein YfaS (alpha-2-macroglobulin family)